MGLFRRHSETPAPASEATRARLQAEQQLAAIKAETPHYRALGVAMRELRERNNFAAAIETSFRGGRP